MSNYSNYEATKEIIQRISKKIPQGIMIGNTTVGHIEWQMYLMRDYLKLDGTPLANASNDYSDLLKFAQDNNLITSDTTDKSLFKYDSTNDVLTLPDFIGLVVQGGSIVEEKEAGLPDIEGSIDGVLNTAGSNDFADGAFLSSGDSSYKWKVGGDGYINRATFDASKSNPIYGNSNTVQPPAITLIPQIKYKRSTTYEGIELGENYSTTEQRIGTWIDGKPLYQVTIVDTMPVVPSDNTNTDKYISISSLSIEKAICLYGMINGRQPLGTPAYFDGVYRIYNFVQLAKSNNSLNYFDELMVRSSNVDNSGATVFVTIKYTKTTD